MPSKLDCREVLDFCVVLYWGAFIILWQLSSQIEVWFNLSLYVWVECIVLCPCHNRLILLELCKSSAYLWISLSVIKAQLCFCGLCSEHLNLSLLCQHTADHMLPSMAFCMTMAWVVSLLHYAGNGFSSAAGSHSGSLLSSSSARTWKNHFILWWLDESIWPTDISYCL